MMYDGTTRNIRKPGDVGMPTFCTFNKICNGLTSWSFEIPASAYCHPLGFIETNDSSVQNMIKSEHKSI